MKSETLQFFGKLDEAAAMHIARALHTVEGVGKVSIVTATSSVQIDFDDDVTSVQELRSALDNAGIRLDKSAHREAGMCCGSCGG